MKKANRLISLLLSLMMVVSMLPVNALAAAEDAEEPAAEPSVVSEEAPAEEPAEEETSESADAETEEPSESAEAETEETSESAEAETEEPSESAEAETEEPSESAEAETEEPSEPADAVTEEPSESADAEEPSESADAVTEETSESADAEETAAEEKPAEEPEVNTETVFTYSDSEKTVTATVADPAVLPAGTVLVVKTLTGAAARQAEQTVQDQLEELTELVEVKSYDVHFEADGQEIEPADGMVAVAFDFKTPILKDSADEDNAELQLVHISDSGEAETLDVDAQNTGDGALKSAEFEVEQFSTFCFATLKPMEVSSEVNKSSLASLFSNMTAIAFGNAEFKIHNMGGILVQGSFQTNDSFFDEGTIPSYVKGEYKGGKCAGRGSRGVTLYVGSVNKVYDSNRNQVTTNGMYINGTDYQNLVFYSSGNGTVEVNDNYVDFDVLKASIKAEMKTLSAGATNTIDVPYDGATLEIPAGSNVKKLKLNGNRSISIKLTGSGSDLELLQKSTIITVEDSGTVYLPLMDQNAYQHGETNNGSGIVFVCPNASTVTTGYHNAFIGHVLAPDADIQQVTGDYNGCLVGNNITAAGEGHVRTYMAKDGTISEPLPLPTPEVDRGTMNVSKSFSGDELTDAQKAEISFVVSGPTETNGETDTCQQVELSGNAYTIPNNVAKLKLTIPYSETNNGSFTLNNLPVGTYTIEEINADFENFDRTTTITNDGTVAVSKDQTTDVQIENTYNEQIVEYNMNISKQDIIGNEIGGAEIVIKDAEGNTVDQWVSEDGRRHTITVQPGTYTFHEENPPTGYVAVTDIIFEVAADGSVSVIAADDEDGVEGSDRMLEVIDQYADHTVTISKTDINGTNEIADAKLTVTDAEGNKVAEWTSEAGKSHDITVQPGTYTLTETTAPDGYEKAESITFVVGIDGKVVVGSDEVEKVVMKDAYSDHTVTISKTDINGTNEIADAKLTVTDAEGNKVAEWTSEAGKSHDITVQPGTYTLTETTAPDGYEKAESITFVVGIDGKVVVGSDEVEKVVMKDAYSDHTVTISKTDINGTNEIADAKLTVTDAEGNKVAEWTSEAGKSHNITVQPGTYTLTETTAPDGYEKAESITFVVGIDGKVTVGSDEVKKVVMKDAYSDHTVTISKTDINGTNEIADAKLTVTDAEGNKVAEWTSEADKSHDITVQPGTYTLTETTAPDGYEKAESITFVVGIDGKVVVGSDEVEKVVMKDAYSDQTVTISKQNVAGEEIADAKIVIKDANGKTVASWTSEADKSHDITVQPGTYTFHEEAAPTGYVAVTDITFTVDKDGNVTVGEIGSNAVKFEDGKLVVTDQYAPVEPVNHTVTISKQNVAGEEIADAKIVIKDANGKTVASWTSEAGKSHNITVQPGTYTFHEEAAPTGYVAVTDITFSVDKDGNVTVGEIGSNAVKIKDGKLVVTDQYAPVEPVNHTVTISKQNVAGEEIADAKIVIKDANGKTVASWTSEADKSHDITVQPGTYTFHEEAAPTGYVAVTDITFTVDKDGKVTVGEIGSNAVKFEDGKLVVTDQYAPEEPVNHTVTISKQNVAGEEIADAKIVIKDANGKTVASWTSEADKSHDITVQPGTYTFHEEAAPTGYVAVTDITFTVDKDGKVTVGEIGSNAVKFEDGKLVVTDQYAPEEPVNHTVTISKQNVAGEEIADAKIVIKDANGKTVASWTSEADKSHDITVQPGTYTFHEEAAPTGYVAVTDITFTVDKDGKVTVGEIGSNAVKFEDGKLVVTDQYAPVEPVNHTVTISKTDINGTNEIADAKLTVTDANGKTVASWTSEAGKSHDITVQPGTYTLTETTAPDGYEKAESITFVVGIDGKVTVGSDEVKKVVMKDAYSDHTVTISKTDINGTNEIADAKLTVTDAEGNQVAEWTSEADKSHDITVQPGTYTLTETTAPDGYEKAESITFVVGIDGKVTVGSDEVKKVVMKDAYSDQTVTISKTDINGTNEIADAKLTVTDANGKTVASWTSEAGKSHNITVKPGTYTLTETTAPGGYEKAESITFVVGIDGKVVVGSDEVEKVVMKDAYSDHTVTISKQNVAGEEIANAKIVIKDANGKTVASWTSEAGKSHNITVQPGTYTFHEEAAPTGYVAVTDITFAVDKDGKVTVGEIGSNAVKFEDGKLVVTDQYAPVEPVNHTVTISKQNVAGEEIADAKIVIKDANGKTVASWTSEAGKSHNITVQPGTYTFHEEAAPTGYVAVTDITFTVDKDGKVTVGEIGSNAVKFEDGKLVVTDQYAPVEPVNHTVTISKQNVAGEEIADAKIVIKDANGKTVASWTSEAGKSHNITVQPGTYTFHEEAAPTGYVAVTDITFTVDKDGKVTVGEIGSNAVKFEDGKLVVTDQYAPVEPVNHTVTISKQNVAGEEIADAKIVIKDANGKTVASWTSEAGKSHDITVQPGTYTFHEEAAPTGYVAVTDITFSVDKDGNVTVGEIGSNAVKIKDGKLVVTDQYAPVEPVNHTVTISKQNVAGEEIADAKIVIKDANGKTVASWTSEAGKSHDITVQPGTYTFHEEAAPTGYVAVTDITFSVDKDGNVTVGEIGSNAVKIKDGKLVVTDQYAPVEPVNHTVTISKTDINGTNEIADAKLTVTDANGKTVASWTSEAGKSHNITVQPGTYTLTETTAPDGYEKAESITFVVGIDGKVTVGSDEVKKVVMKDAYSDHTVTISKTDINGTNEIADAKLTVTDAEGNKVAEWISEAGKSHNITVQPGTYTLTETSAPDGYEKAESITFVVGIDGKVVVGSDEVEKVVMKDAYSDHTVTISKTDINGTNEIADAKLTVTDANGKTVESWTSEAGKSHNITVQPGTYTLTETTAPDGYEKAESITFVVGIDGKVVVGSDEVKKVVMKDAYSDHTVTISKTDINGTNEIADAKLTVTDAKGNKVAEWTSEAGKSHNITVQPGTYTLTETTAPDGYEKAESITFVVGIDGKVTVGSDEVKKVVMKDAYSDHTVTISKTDINGTNEIAGAKLTVTDANGKTVASWTSEAGKSHNITVQPGTYTLTETTAPDGYEKAESITFVVGIDGKVTVGSDEVKKVVMKDAYSDHTVTISKTDINGTNEIADAKLTVTDANGKTVASWTSEAGKSHNITVQPGTYTLTETTAPDGYEKAESITFVVGIDGKVVVGSDEVKKVVMKDAYSDHTVTISKTDINGTNEIADAKLTVTDAENNKVAEWISEAGKSHDITVQPGTYTLTETTAPDGYEKAESITFVVGIDGKVVVGSDEVKKVVMKDAYSDHTVTISKTDINGTNEIADAKLTVTDANGKTVASWTSEAGKSHDITVQPGTYTLTETTAPDGYEKAESITFVVGIDGKVVVGSDEVKKVVMKDAYSDHTVTISKTDINGTNEIADAKLTVTDAEGNKVAEWTSEADKSHNITVQPGTYTLTETTAPDGYEKAESITFVVGIDGKVTVGGNEVEKVVMKDDYTKYEVSFSRQNDKGTRLGGARLTVYNEDGEVVYTWDSEKTDITLRLPAGDYMMVEEDAPEGYEKGEPISFTVKPDGTVVVNGKVVKDKTVVIENGPAQTTTPTNPDTVKPSENRNTSSGASPKTSDAAPVMETAALLSAAGIGLLVTRKKKKED